MATINVTKCFNSEFPFERGMKEASKNYCRLVFSVNKMIIKFNKQLQQEENEDNCLELILNFVGNLLKINMVHEIINWPKTNIMQNLRILIQNPCYS